MSAAALLLLVAAVLVLAGSAGSGTQGSAGALLPSTTTSTAVHAVGSLDAVDAGTWSEQDGDDRPDAVTEGPQPARSAPHSTGPAHEPSPRSARSAAPVVTPD